ncbi:MAG: acyl-CoA dehydrogenase [Bacteroidetes bacterium]|nr:acyl-CoA dehydrogenase [Bacteroidota bacterium]
MATIFVVLILVALFYHFPFWLLSILILSVAIYFNVSNFTLYLLIGIAVLLNFTVLRRYLITYGLMKLIKKLNLLPKISETEKVALESGTVWMDAELFNGKPNLKKLFGVSPKKLTQEEEDFLNGPVEKLCQMVSDWDVYKKRGFEKDVWQFMKEKKFFGLIIQKKYGGLEFSANAHSKIIQKLSSRTPSLGITVMVPNSLGPAELIIHYGTDEQKNYYLPRLAVGKEIPCFALTEPLAGSDAGSISSTGIIFKKSDGTIWIRLNWDKRYITLASVSTLLGIAFKLNDTENILGKGNELGITCALIPSETKGVTLQNRHDPLNVPFINSPTHGVDVEVPISNIIGGLNGVGKGWKMLMECLAAGRGISLPASSTAGVKFVTRVVSAYASVRKQFGLAIGKFEGIEEPISRIVGSAYLLEALRNYTCMGIDEGAKPAIVTAISKYHSTEINRKVVNDGMDILGGAAISLGKNNLIASSYFSVPIAITVEGANILTRSLIIFGQGIIRCHKFVLKEMEALENNNLRNFDFYIFKHFKHLISNLVRSTIFYLTRGFFIFQNQTSLNRYAQKLIWSSSQFAFWSDFALFTLGGNLKRKETISARFGDVLSWMYIATAIINKFENSKNKSLELPLAKWSLDFCFAKIQESFESIFNNMGGIAKLEYYFEKLNPIGKPPSDKLSSIVAQQIQNNSELRELVTEGIFISKNEEDTLFKLEKAFALSLNSQIPIHKLNSAIKNKIIPKTELNTSIENGIQKGIISEEEANLIYQSEKLAKEVIAVDEFTDEEYFGKV